MRRIALAWLLVAGGATAKDKATPVALTQENHFPSGAFSFKTPAGWKVEPVAGNAEAIQASGDGVLVRFVYRSGDAGFDSLHVTCMLERLAAEKDAAPQVRYEYDFLSGEVNEMRILDSAFEVSYDAEIQGSRAWRQRNVTVVGKGHSLCAISYAPAALWKKSKATRATLDGILASVSFR